MYRGAAAIALCLLTAGLEAQQRPLPDPRAFLQEARKHLRAAEEREDLYMYVETRRERELDEHGRTRKETVQVFESYPGLPGEGRWDRQTVEDGRPIEAERLAEQDRDRQEHVRKYLRSVGENPARERANQARKREEERRELAEILAEMERIYDVRMLGRESLEGQDAIVFSLTPRAGVKPRTREGRLMRKLAGRLWISERDYEVARIEIETLDTILVGWGVLARVHKGSRAAYERRKVNGEVWLPARFSYQATARVGLVKVVRRSMVAEYSGHRRFDVQTAESYALPGR
jgi:hypothetical protein